MESFKSLSSQSLKKTRDYHYSPSDRDPPARGLPARQQADMDDDEGVAFEGETIKPLVERVRAAPAH